MALHESKFQGRSTNATGSPISHFCRSFVLYFLCIFTILFFSHSYMALRIHSRVLSRNEFFSFVPGTRASKQQWGYRGSSTISRRDCRATFRSRRSYTVHECRRKFPRTWRLETTTSKESTKFITWICYVRALCSSIRLSLKSTRNTHERSRAYIWQCMYVLRSLTFHSNSPIFTWVSQKLGLLNY